MPPLVQYVAVSTTTLNFSQFVEGRSWGTCERGGRVEACLCGCDWLSNGEERRCSSARFYTLPSGRHCVSMFDIPPLHGCFLVAVGMSDLGHIDTVSRTGGR